MDDPVAEKPVQIANPEYYSKQFGKFDENGGKYRLAWNWASEQLEGFAATFRFGA